MPIGYCAVLYKTQNSDRYASLPGTHDAQNDFSSTDKMEISKNSPKKLQNRSDFLSLPLEIHANIASHLGTTPHEQLLNLNALKRTSRQTARIVHSNMIGPRYEALRDASQKSHALWQKCSNLPPAEKASALGNLLPVIPSSYHSELLPHMPHQMTDEDSETWSLAVQRLWPNMRYFSAEDQQKLMTTVRQLPVEQCAEAIQCAGHHLHQLPPARRDQLVEIAMSLPQGDSDTFEDAYTFEAICGLADGLQHLTSSQQTALVTKINSLPDSDDRAMGLAALAKQFPFLKKNLRDQVFNSCMEFEEEESLAQTIAGLGESGDSLSEKQLTTLMNRAMEIQNEFYKSTAFAGLTKNFSALSEQQKKSIFDFATTLTRPDFSVKMIGGLASQPEHVPELLKMLSESPRFAADEEALANGLHELAQHSKNLSNDQITVILDKTKNIKNDWHRQKAIIGLSYKLQDMSTQHIKTLTSLIKTLQHPWQMDIYTALASKCGLTQNAPSLSEWLTGWHDLPQHQQSVPLAALGESYAERGTKSDRERMVNSVLSLNDIPDDDLSTIVSGFGQGISKLATYYANIKLDAS